MFTLSAIVAALFGRTKREQPFELLQQEEINTVMKDYSNTPSWIIEAREKLFHTKQLNLSKSFSIRETDEGWIHCDICITPLLRRKVVNLMSETSV